MCAALTAAVVVGVLTAPGDDWDLAVIAILVVSAVVSELTSITLPDGKIGISGAFLAIVLAIVLLGGAPGAVVGVATILGGWLRWREAPVTLLSNLVAYTWFPLLSGLGFFALIDGFGIGTGDAAYYLLIFATFLVALALNFLIVATYQCHLDGSGLLTKARESLVPILASELFSAVLAVATAFVYVHLGLPALALVGVVMLVFQYLLGELLLSQERGRELERRGEQLHRLSVTDELTGLGNRRKLMSDIEHALSDEGPEASVLVIYDLDGFKRWNDRYGHSGGDRLLRLLGERLTAALGPQGHAYRLGGDEFCALIEGDHEASRELVAAGAEALHEQDEKVVITCCHGGVVLPDEATDPIEALRIADQRMYVRKDARPMSAKGQVRDMLLRVLDEQQPDLHDHSNDVSDLSRAVAVALGMSESQVDDTIRLAELHDVGKIAIPQAILRKPGPLDDDEWRVMRLHTIIGERMLRAAPALGHVGRLVRASHERWDGGGYPDGLEGDDIPLPARIVSACDAYDAMVTDRPYRRGMSIDEAIAELRDCAGSQFDPRVVDALVSQIERTRRTVTTPELPASAAAEERGPTPDPFATATGNGSAPAPARSAPPARAGTGAGRAA
ncbi:MAG: diguanylate cyclase [Solirubrobacteraceae bacterium]